MNPPGSTGFSFGQSAPQGQPAPSAFGQPTASPGGFNLGQAANPLTSSSGFSLGQTNPSSSSAGFSFGQTNPVTSSAGFSFAQPNAAPVPAATSSLGGFSFAQPNAAPPSSAGGFSLGQTNPTTLPGLNSGLSTGTSSAGLFGAAPSTGFSIQPSASSTSNLSSGLFSQTPTSVPIASTASAGTNLFGQTQVINPVSSSTGMFGQGPTAGSTTGLLTQPTTSSLFGQTSKPTTQLSSGLTMGLSTNPIVSGGLFNQTSNAPTSAGLNFGVSASPSTGFNAISSTPCFSSTPSSGGLGGASVAPSSIFSSIAATTSAPNLGLGGCLPTSSTLSTAGGLGGFQTSSVDSSTGNNISKADGKSAKEAPLPQDIFSTIATFESYKDSEKKCSEDNIRQTAAPFHKLVEDTKKLRQHIVKLSNQHNQLHSSARKLKSAVIQEAENVEMTRRTQATPMNLQGDNTAPEAFFLQLVRSFEERMTFCRNRIQEVDKCARSNGGAGGDQITSEDMKEVLKKEHEMVKMLAAKIYTLHNQLINFTNHSSNPDIHIEALFKPVTTDQNLSIGGISNQNSSLSRPALGEGGSGLLNFQNGQQRAKAVSLGAAPPTLPLAQSAMPNLMGSSTPNTLFGNSSNSTFGSSSFLNFNTTNNNNNNAASTGFGFGTKTAFGASNSLSGGGLGVGVGVGVGGGTGSLFGNQTLNQSQNSTLFGSPANNSLFGSAKSFKK